MISEFEIYNDQNYFENDRKTLKTDYLLYYYSHPHWSAIPRSIRIYIDKEYSYEIKMHWYKMTVGKRLFSSYRSNLLPDDIIKVLKKLNNLENISLNQIYSSKEGFYSPEGLSEDSYSLNHNSKTISINMSSYWTDEKLFVSKEEKLFLKLHKLMETWKEKLYQDIIRLHD